MFTILLLYICHIFLSTSFSIPHIDNSRKNVCIFLSKQTVALFGKVDRWNFSKGPEGEGGDMQHWHLFRQLTFVYWHIEGCVVRIIIGRLGWWLSDHLAATVSCWWGSPHTTYIVPPPPPHPLLPTLLAMHLQWAEGTITDPSRYLVKTWTHSEGSFFLLMR